MAYLSELQTDWMREQSTSKTRYAGNPTFHEAMHGDNQEQYLESMNIEISSFLQHRAWKSTPKSEAARVLK
jgi:hypothetical protein